MCVMKWHMSIEATQEMLEVAKKTHCALEISHIKIADTFSWGKSVQLLNMIHQYQAQGTLVHMDAYPYEAAGNMLATTLMPPEFLMEQGDAINEYLLQPIAKQKATEYLYEKMRNLIGSLKTPIRQILLHLPSNFMVNQVLNMMSKRILILSALNEPELDNKTLFNIAQMRHKPVLDTAFEMIIKNQSQITIAPVVMTFKDIDNFLLDPDCMPRFRSAYNSWVETPSASVWRFDPISSSLCD